MSYNFKKEHFRLGTENWQQLPFSSCKLCQPCRRSCASRSTVPVPGVSAFHPQRRRGAPCWERWRSRPWWADRGARWSAADPRWSRWPSMTTTTIWRDSSKYDHFYFLKQQLAAFCFISFAKVALSSQNAQISANTPVQSDILSSEKKKMAALSALML